MGIFNPAELKQHLQTGKVLPTDLAWVEGETNWMPVADLPPEYLTAAPKPPPLPQTKTVAYHCVPMWRFVICSLITSGLYTMWWILRCWVYIQRRDGSNIWPFWRMVFAPVWMFSLADDIERHTKAPVRRAPLIAGLFLFANFAVFFPEPFWLIGLFGFVPLLPLVRQVEEFNKQNHDELVSQPVFCGRHIILCAVFLPYLILSLLVEFQVIPGTRVLEGRHLRARNIAYLQKEGIIGESEPVVYFYSGTYPLSWRGVILTDQRLIRYQREPGTGERLIEMLYLKDITRVDVTRPSFGFLETEVKVQAGEQTMEFRLGVYYDRDEEFTQALKNYVPRFKSESVEEPLASDREDPAIPE